MTRSSVRSLLLVVPLALACSATGNGPEPYRSDVSPAAWLQRRAAARCTERRGANDLPPRFFHTGGCTLWPDDGWTECCIEHDIAYWCGGSEADRVAADRALEACLAKRAGGMGDAVYAGVRAGGSPWLPVPWRWGYGWPWPRGYDAAAR